MDSFLPGMEVSHFQLVEKIGVGSSGEVFRAEDILLKRPVALKILASFCDPTQKERFLREARLCSVLIHPNIAILYEAGWIGSVPFLAIELIEGQMLSRKIREKPMTAEQAIRYMKEILDALGEAHTRGIIHRDIKSANIMITSRDHVKILDFGLGRAKSEPSRLTTPGRVLGTLEFLSPEQARGATVDHRSDLFSAGVVFFHMLTGHLPFEREQTIGTYSAILKGRPLPLSTFIPGASSALERIVKKAVASDVEARYQSADEFLQDLTRMDSSAEPLPAELAQTTDPLSIAVLYFDRLGDQQEGEYLRLGITEDIITDLSKITGIRVLSRHAVQKYKDKTPDPPAIAQDLQVRFLLHGTVEKSGEKILVNARLWDQSVSGFVWSQAYEREMQDIFDLQEEVAGSITAALEIRLTESERRSIQQRSTASLKAYECFLRGRHHYNEATSSDNRIAEEMFLQAIRLDSGFAAAHAGLAEVYVQRFYHWFDRDRLWLKKAEGAVFTAQQIDDRLPEVHCTSGMLLYLNGDYQRAMEQIQKAIRLDPNYTLAHDHTGEIYLHNGELEKAILAFHTEMRINPDVIYPYFYLVWIHSLLGDWTIAKETLEKARLKHPKDPLLFVLEGILSSYSGHLEEAADFLSRAIHENPSNSFAAGRLAVVYAEMEKWDEAIRIAQSATEQIDPRDHHAAFDRACVHAMHGDISNSFAWLNNAIDLGWRCRSHFERERNLSAVRKDFRFADILMRL